MDPDCAPGSSLAPFHTCCDHPGLGGCCKAKNAFAILSGLDTSGPYDIGSIMQYRRGAFAKSGTNTLTPVGSAIIPFLTPGTPSKKDVERLCRIYKKCPLYTNCVNNNCPAICSSAKPCNSQKCNSDFPPECCFNDPESCDAEKLRCKNLGCDIFK